MVCPTCYQDYISKCSNSLTINAGLNSDDNYTARFEDKFQGFYFAQFTTDGDGLGIIDLTESLPDGFFNPASGWFKLVITASGRVQPIIIDEIEYDCIEFNVVDGNHVKTYLGEFTEEPVSS